MYGTSCGHTNSGTFIMGAAAGMLAGAALGAATHGHALGKGIAAFRQGLAGVGEHRAAGDDDLVPLVPGAASLADGVAVHVAVGLQHAAVDVDVAGAGLAGGRHRVGRSLVRLDEVVAQGACELVGVRLGAHGPPAAADGGAVV